MQKKKGIVALVATLCVIFSVVLCGVMARAEDGVLTLTVNLAVSTDEEYTDDLFSAPVVVDVFKFGAAEFDRETETFTYGALESAFASLQADFDAAQSGKGDWQEVAESAKTLVTEDLCIAKGRGLAETIEALDDGSAFPPGVYLVLARNPQLPVGSTTSYSGSYEYQYQAALISLPSKDPDESGEIRTDYGDWLDDVTVSLKSARKPRTGSIVINKQVINATNNREATFVFHIVGTTPEGEPYENYAAITYPSQSSTRVKGIPAGTVVTVTEESIVGERYRFVEGGGTETVVADSDSGETLTPAFNFVNEPNGGHNPGGHGIENHFEPSITRPGDYDLVATPGDKRIDQ